MPNCCIPGCTYEYSSAHERSLFSIRRPDLGRTAEERKHRSDLTKFILSIRDASKGDRIKELLHKETALICEKHFEERDINRSNSSAKLISGALPTKFLPVKCRSIKVLQRKSPVKRKALPARRVRHLTLHNLETSYSKLSPQMKDRWVLHRKENSLLFLCNKSEEKAEPSISVSINENLETMYVAYSGWRCSDLSQLNTDLCHSTLFEYLSDLERHELCKGVVATTKNTTPHYLQTWSGDHMEVVCINRSPKCSCIVLCSSIGGVCRQCSCYDARTKRNREFSKETISSKQELVEVQEDFHNDVVELYRQEEDGMNEWQRMFFEEQCANASKCSNGRRYHPDVVRWALELYARSPAAYEHIRTSAVLTLPSSKTLYLYKNSLVSNPGINPVALDAMRKLSSPVEAYITLDEMKVRENLVMKNGGFVGLVDYGDRKCEEKLATHICMFYLRSFKKEISIPLAWWPTANSTPPHKLTSMFLDAVITCENEGVHINAVVADGASTNRKFFEILHGKPLNITCSFTCPNPCRLDQTIYMCLDTSHLLKCVRNGLYSSKPNGTKYFHKAGHDLLWTHIQDLYKIESLTVLRKTRLSDCHMQLTSFSKMKVSYARETLSWAVGNALMQDVQGSQGTANFVFLFSKWFETVTCRAINPIRSCDDERLKWLEGDFLQYLLEWKNEVSAHPGEEKRVLAKSTLEGLIFTTLNMVALCKRLLNRGYEYVSMGILTQDVLEATFGNLRASNRRCSNPDINQVTSNITALSHRKSVKQIHGGNTTFGKKNAWTEVCNEPLKRRKAKNIQNSTELQK